MIRTLPFIARCIPLAAFVAGCGGCAPEAQELAQARAQFQTHLVADTLATDGEAPLPPPGVFDRVHYRSAVGDLVAYVTPDPGDGKRHPALLWAHGGYGGIGDYLWQAQSPDNDQSVNAFLRSDLVVMTPSWRGENDNPGRFEMFYGEVEDLHAARDYLAGLPYVDSERIYLAGHSTGGTLTLLAAQLRPGFRAAFSLGGIPDLKLRLELGPTSTDPPFDLTDPREYELRSPARFPAPLKSRTYYFEGEHAYWEEFEDMERNAAAAGRHFQAFPVPGGDHFNIIAPLTAMLARKIIMDSGVAPVLEFSEEEVAALLP